MLNLFPPLPDRALTWLRRDASTPDDPLAVALAAGLAARRLPAWIERPASIVRAQIVLAGRLDDRSATPPRARDEIAVAVAVTSLLALIESGGAYGFASRSGARETRRDRVVAEQVRLVSDADVATVAGSLDLDAITDPGAIRRGIRAGLALLLADTASGTDAWRRHWTTWWLNASPAMTMMDPAVLVELVPQDSVAARVWFETWLDADGLGRAQRRALASSSDLGSRAQALRELIAAVFVAREFDLAATAQSADAAWSDAHGSGIDAWRAAADLVRPGWWRALATEPAVPVPQVIDIEQPELALARAEWQRGSLFLRLVPTEQDQLRRTTFRIVGAEPRVWCFTGVDGAVLDCTSSAQIVILPMLAADVEFSEGSY